MTCLGVNFYYWGARQQDRFLVECLGPAVDELRRENLVERFWFDRFDRRGPHLFVLLTPPQGAEGQLVERLAARLDPYLAEHPSTEVLSPEFLARLDEETRGKRLCVEDAHPGIAPNNSYSIFAHDPQGYPFELGAGLPGEADFWLLVGDLARWAIQQIASPAGGSTLTAAVHLAAGADAALARAGVAQIYWRLHATTLLTSLEQRLADKEDEVLTSLARLLGERNRAALARLWAPELQASWCWPHLPRLVALTLPGEGRPFAPRFLLLREALHCTWKQLGLPVRSHLPLVLFAWLRNLLLAPAATG